MSVDREGYHAKSGGEDSSDTRTQSNSDWRLVREIGLEYKRDPVPQCRTPLRGPMSVEKVSRDCHLVVDETQPERGPEFNGRRTFLLSTGRGILFDSEAARMDDAHGCLMGRDQFAVALRSRSEIRIMSLAGSLRGSIDLSRVSKGRLQALCWTPNGTFLLAFLSRSGIVDLAELDHRGRVRWCCVDSIATLGTPASLQLLPDRSIVIADEFHHVVWRLDRYGASRILWGRFHSPGSAQGCLHGPKWAQLLADGTLLIADSRNSRILAIDRAGRAADVRPRNAALLAPSCIRRLRGGRYLVSDSSERCIFEMTATGEVRPLYGSLHVRQRAFSWPRSVEYLGKGSYLIADTANDAIATASRGTIRRHPVSGKAALFWPRAVRRLRSGNLLVADARNSRILEAGPAGAVQRQLFVFRHEEKTLVLVDPHDVRLQRNRSLLIVDSARNLVIETDWHGRARWVLGLSGDLKLRDPHSAQQLPDGRVMIADTYNHRILFVDPLTHASSSLTEIRTHGTTCVLRQPRYAECLPDGTLAIADSGNDRVLLTDLEFSFLAVLAEVPESPNRQLRSPRWVQPLSRNEIVISDYGNHRVLHLRRQIAYGGAARRI